MTRLPSIWIVASLLLTMGCATTLTPPRPECTIEPDRKYAAPIMYTVDDVYVIQDPRVAVLWHCPEIITEWSPYSP